MADHLIQLETPTTKNVVTFIVYNADGSIDEQRDIENKYLAPGFLSLTNGANMIYNAMNDYGSSIYSQCNAISYYSNTGINYAGYTDQSYGLAAFRYVMLSTSQTELVTDAYTKASSISSPKHFAGLSNLGYGYHVDVEFDYSYGGKEYLSNVMKYDFGYGTLNNTFNSLYQTSSNNNDNASVTTQILIPDGLEIDETQRLVVLYRHLFDYKKYYNGSLQDKTLVLKDEYKNITIYSGTFMDAQTSRPFNVVVPALMTPTLSDYGLIQFFSNFITTLSITNATRPQTFNYNTNQTYTENINPNGNTANTRCTCTNISNGVRKGFTIVLQASAPAMTGLYKINLQPGYFTIANQGFDVNFPTPWNKPIDMEFTINVQWDEIWSQSA